MITVEQITETTEADIHAAVDKLGIERLRFLSFEHGDPLIRAGFQAVTLKLAAGAIGDATPNEAEVRATPAGRAIPLDQPALLAQRKTCGCRGSACDRPEEVTS